MDKIDGPYYFFKLLQRLRHALPEWVPLAGPQGGDTNIVPVDFVARAMDHIAHLPDDDLPGDTFHLVNPEPMTVGETLNEFAKAAHAPQLAMRVDSNVTNAIPKPVRAGLMALPTVKRIRNQIYHDLGIPPAAMENRDFHCKFDARDAQRALTGTGIAVPPLGTYAPVLWDYWERNLDPDLFRERSLASSIKGKRILITGASSGIGLETAVKIGEAGGEVILVSRTREKLEEVAKQVEDAGGTAHVHPADLSDLDEVDRLAAEVLEQHGGVDVLVNNAGRSIRRSVKASYDRFHDYERTMQLNYFGALKLILAFMPGMRERRSGHIVNVSSIGVQTNTPRFSAYVASKSALDAFSRCVAPEVIGDNVNFTTVFMPLVRTPMIAPTDIYKAFPTLTPEEAAQMLCDAMIDKPKRMASRLGTLGEILYSISPKSVDIVLNTAYNLFPDSHAAKKKKTELVAGEAEQKPDQEMSIGGRGDGLPAARGALLAKGSHEASVDSCGGTRDGGARDRRRRRRPPAAAATSGGSTTRACGPPSTSTSPTRSRRPSRCGRASGPRSSRRASTRPPASPTPTPWTASRPRPTGSRPTSSAPSSTRRPTGRPSSRPSTSCRPRSPSGRWWSSRSSARSSATSTTPSR